jgi:Protein of unknown function (DUF3237)
LAVTLRRCGGFDMDPDFGATDYQPKLDFAFDLALEFHSRLRFGPTQSGGAVGFVGISGGRVKGPKLNGKIISNSGGDWANMRADGVVEFRAHYLIEADDGTIVHVHNTGYGRANPEQLAMGEAFDGRELQEHYFRVTPRFETPVGRHDWLTRMIVLGFGERRRNPDHTVFHYFTVL